MNETTRQRLLIAATVIRIGISLLLVWGIYGEAGIWTALFAFGTFVYIESSELRRKTLDARTDRLLSEIGETLKRL